MAHSMNVCARGLAIMVLRPSSSEFLTSGADEVRNLPWSSNA